MRATASRLIHPGIAHGALLPSALVACVPPSEKLVLNFVLSYLEAEALPAQLLINGGYVRDLLLGKTPDDLDLSLCLRDCPPEVTIDGVLKGLSAFAHCQPNLNVSSVNVTTILSDTSKDKNVDTAKAHLLVGSPAERIEVDFMPTIGEERSRGAHPAIRAVVKRSHARSPRRRAGTTSTTACRCVTCAAPRSRTRCAAT